MNHFWRHQRPFDSFPANARFVYYGQNSPDTPPYDRVTDLGGLGQNADPADNDRRMAAGAPAPAPDTPAAPAPAAPATVSEPERFAGLTPRRATDAAEAEPDVQKRRKTVRRKIDAEFKAGVDRYKSACLDALKPKNLQKLTQFVDAHPEFAAGTKATDWNQDFCTTVLGQGNLSQRETIYAVYALQQALNETMLQITGDLERGYVFKDRLDDGKINSHTRIDGYMGAYTVSALRYFLAYVYRTKDPTVAAKNWRTQIDPTSPRSAEYDRAIGHLKNVFFPSAPEPHRALGTTVRDDNGSNNFEVFYNKNLTNYLAFVRRKYPITADNTTIFNPNTPQFKKTFEKMLHYLQIRGPIDYPNTWPNALNHTGLTPQEMEILLPNALIGEPDEEKIDDRVDKNYPFKSADLRQFKKGIKSFYKSHHWTNYDGLATKGEADAAWFTARDFLEKPEFSTQEVRDAYQAYLDARNNFRAQTISQEDFDKAFKALGTAIDHQQKQAEEAIRYWAQPGRLPEGRYLHKSDLEGVRKKLSENFPYPFLNQIWHDDPAHEVLKPVFRILKDYDKSVAFKDFAELEASTYPNEFQVFQTQLIERGLVGFLDNIPAQEPMRSNTIKENNEKVLKLFNSAIWCRNIDLFLSAEAKHFLPPEK